MHPHHAPTDRVGSIAMHQIFLCCLEETSSPLFLWKLVLARGVMEEHTCSDKQQASTLNTPLALLPA
jgi:hypothetical protein